jgi:putative transposase
VLEVCLLQVCRKLGVSEQTCYRWQRQFAGMGIAELRRRRRRRRQREEENRRLQQLVADLTLDRHMLQAVSRKKLSRRRSRSPWWTSCASALQ